MKSTVTKDNLKVGLEFKKEFFNCDGELLIRSYVVTKIDEKNVYFNRTSGRKYKSVTGRVMSGKGLRNKIENFLEIHKEYQVI
jgi:hypothetical protein